MRDQVEEDGGGGEDLAPVWRAMIFSIIKAVAQGTISMSSKAPTRPLGGDSSTQEGVGHNRPSRSH